MEYASSRYGHSLLKFAPHFTGCTSLQDKHSTGQAKKGNKNE